MSAICDIDAVCELVRGVVRLTIRDAQAGDMEAIEWLWTCAPALAERLGLPVVIQLQESVNGERKN